MKPYVATVHLVKRPPATRKQWLYVAGIAYDLGQSIVGSADDAIDVVEDAQPGSTIYIWEPQWWDQGSIHEYLQRPGVMLIDKYFEQQPAAIAVQVWPIIGAFGQINASATRLYQERLLADLPVQVQRMNTSQPDNDSLLGWPLL